MSSTLDTLQQAADITKRIGNATLPNGKSVRNQLSVDGVSFWDAAEPLLAAFLFPKDLSRERPPTVFDNYLMPYLRLFRNKARALKPFPRNDSGCAKWPSGRVCLFLGFSGYMYRDILEPIKKHFDETHEMDSVVLHDGGSFQKTAVKLSGAGVHSIWEHWDASLDSEEIDAGVKLNEAVKALKAEHLLSAFRPEESAAIAPKIEGTLRWLLIGYLASLIPYFLLARHILKAHRNSILVSCDQADPRTRLFCQVGRAYGIPCLEVQFGLCSKDGVEWQFPAVDKIAVWGNSAKQVIAAHGVPERNILLTGSPRFDGLVNIPPAHIKDIRARLGIPDGKAMVLFASQYLLKSYSEFGDFPGIQRAIKRAVFNSADRLSDMVLVVKPHPLEDVNETRKLADGCRHVIFVDKSEDIRELTKACDVFVTLGSTATMEALIAGKLVIYPAFPGFVWWDDMYLNNSVAVVAKSETELIAKLRDSVTSRRREMLNELEPARHCFLRDLIHKPDGLATSRISARIMEMAVA